MAQSQAIAWLNCEKRLQGELSRAEHAKMRALYSPELLSASLQMLKAGRESLRHTNNWDRLINVLGLLEPVAIAADVLAEGLCIPSKTLWGSLGLVVEAVSGNRKYLDYVLHLYEDLLQRLPRVESYSPQALQSPALRLALSDSFQLQSSLAVRCLKTFGRASKQGILTKIRWVIDQHGFEQDLQRLGHLLRKVDEEAGHALRLERRESEERRYVELMEKQDVILSALADKGAGKTGPVQAERFTVPWTRSRSFIGRQSILAEIHSHLAQDGEGAGSHQRSVAICGLGGVGKTQIALEYAHLYRDDYQACFWVTCDVRVKITSAFSDMARVLGFAGMGTDQNLMSMMDWFRTTTDTWLLIFDNAEEPQSLERFWPPSRNGSILLTSQDTSWVGQETINHGINIRSLDTDDGVKLLQGIFSRWKRTISQEAAEGIVQETGGLPLALRQIGSYICTIGTDPEEFVARYNEAQSSTGVDQWSESAQPSYTRTLATFLDFSFSKLGQRALTTLGVFCFVDADNVWAEVLSGSSPGQLFPVDSPEYDENVRALCRHSLIYMDRNQDGVVFSIHREVKRRLFHRLDDAQLTQGLQWITTKIRHLFPRQVPYEEDLSDKNKACARYIPHILALNDALSRTSHLSKDPAMLAQLLLDGGIYLWSKRLLDDAQALLDRSQLLCERCGEEKVLLSEIYSIRAAVLADSGNGDEALKYFEQAMAVIKGHLMAVRGNEGAYDQIYLANAYNNLGAMYAQLGDYDRAKTQIEVSLFLKKKWQGHNVPMSHLLCLSYQNLGNINAQLGDIVEAARYFEKALETATVESSTLRIALTYHNYGALNLAESNLGEARRLLEEAYQLRVEALGDSQDTAATLHLLACCHCQSGGEASLEAARLLLVEAVRILRQRRSKLYKSRLARSLFKLSLVLADLRDAESVQHRDEAHEIWKEVTGGGQPPEGEEGWDALLPYV